jgi:hypothetical protein
MEFNICFLVTNEKGVPDNNYLSSTRDFIDRIKQSDKVVFNYINFREIDKIKPESYLIVHKPLIYDLLPLDKIDKKLICRLVIINATRSDTMEYSTNSLAAIIQSQDMLPKGRPVLFGNRLVAEKKNWKTTLDYENLIAIHSPIEQPVGQFLMQYLQVYDELIIKKQN